MKQFRVLIVDDSDIDRMFIRMSLENTAARSLFIEEAHGGISARAAMAQCDYDAIVLDIRMPGESGLDVLRSIRERTEASWPLVVMCTSSNHPNDVNTAYGRHANAYVCKPASFDGYQRLAELFHGLLDQLVYPQVQENLPPDTPIHRG